jgi:ATP-binding cassette subfamily B protein
MRGRSYVESDQLALSTGNDSYSLSKVPRNIKPLRELIPYLKPYKKQLLFAFIALLISSSAVLTLGQGLNHVVDFGLASGRLNKLDEILALLLLLIVVLASATFARFYFISWVGERMVADIRKNIFQHILRLSPSFFETAKSGDLISRMNTDTSLLQTLVGSSVSVALRNFLLFIGGTIMLLITSMQLTMIVFCSVPVVIVPIIILGRFVKKLSKEAQSRISGIGSGLEETIYGIRTIQAFGREEAIEKSFAARVEDAFGTALKRITARSWMIAVVMTLVFSAVAIILWRGGHDMLSHVITGGQLTAFVFYAVLVAGAVGALSEVFGDLQQAAGAMERILELLAVEPEIKAPEKPRRMPFPGYGEIHFDRVSFFYPSRPQAAAIDHFELRVRSGEKVAIVGPSGAGKSTLFQLLLRFYDPQMGTLFVDNLNITEVDPHDLREKISYVPQEVMIFSTDAMANIRLARPEATDEEVMAAAEAAKAHEFLMELPQGYQTFLGEKGVRLSGGQRQRIGLARAALRNTPILLLDEATSALDSQSEKAIQTAFAQITQGRTTLIIAHRLSTIQHCNRIVVVDKGHIVEAGTHDDLLMKDGLYAKLSKLQLRA